MFPKHEYEPTKFAPNFITRKALQATYEREIKNGSEFKYKNFLGDYGWQTEVHLSQLASQLLDIKTPVVFLDIGGGVGLSWTKVAKQFVQEIHQGKIAFVVSNFQNPPDKFIEERRLPEEEKQKKSDRALQQGYEHDYFLPEEKELDMAQEVLREGQGSVIRVAASFGELSNKHIVLPSGKSIFLSHNVDVIHERFSLTAWSLVPEVDILNIAKLSSPYATYLVSQRDLSSPQGDLPEEDENIRNGIALARQELQDRFGFFEKNSITLGENKLGNPMCYAVLSQLSA